jgi:hypothetical protein
MTMRTLLLSALLAGIAGQAVAGGPTIQLDNAAYNFTAKDDVGRSLYMLDGKCGAAAVRWFKLTRDDDGAYRSGGDSILTVEGPGGKFTSKDNAAFAMENANELVCVATPKGPRLLLAAWCTARNCPPVYYNVIDAKSAKLLTKNDYEAPCDRKCAEKALGAKVPKALLEF